MTVLHCDFETRSLIDLPLRGLDNYVSHPSTKVLMLSWAFDDDEVQLWQPHLMPELPKEIRQAIESDVTLSAWNATFELNVFDSCLHTSIGYNRWLDPMVWARHLSFPGSLAECGALLGLSDEQGKIKDGKRLIQKFSIPYTMGGEATLFGVTVPDFLDWDTDPDDWKLFGEYCIRDTQAEREILKRMQVLPLPEIEQRGWILDQKINHRGIPVNPQFVQNALFLAERAKDDLDRQLKEKTGLVNPNSRDQILKWASAQGYPYHSMRKEFVVAALNDLGSGMSGLCREVLKLRQDSSKTSYKKYETIQQLVAGDNRVRNQYLFLGAARTGRWSGTGFQPQNPPRPIKEVEEKYDRALELVTAADYLTIKNEFSSVTGVVTSVVRSAIQAPTGNELHVCDLNAIENRVLGWLARCDGIMQVFREGRCPYLSFASKMYNIPYEQLYVIENGKHVAKDKDAKGKRQVAKPAVLGAGYGLGPGVERIEIIPDTSAMSYKERERLSKFREVTVDRGATEPEAATAARMAAEIEGKLRTHYRYEPILKTDQYGNTIKTGLLGYAENMQVKLSPEQAYLAWETFRRSYPEVVLLWYDLERAALEVLELGGKMRVGVVEFRRVKNMLVITLPSGRGLHYLNARIEMRVVMGRNGKPRNKPSVLYDGIGHGVGKMGEGWGPVYIYGGKFAENIVQAISRDLLLNGMLLADDMGACIVHHAHDEIVAESEKDPFAFTLNDLRWCMTQAPLWAPGLPLAADGYTSQVYKKG